MGRRSVALSLVASLALLACSGSDGDDDEQPPTIGGINGPAMVDPSFDPFVTDPSAPSATDGG